MLASDGLILTGGGLTAYGAWLAYPPAGFIVGGVELMVFGWFVGGDSWDSSDAG